MHRHIQYSCAHDVRIPSFKSNTYKKCTVMQPYKKKKLQLLQQLWGPDMNLNYFREVKKVQFSPFSPVNF